MGRGSDILESNHSLFCQLDVLIIELAVCGRGKILCFVFAFFLLICRDTTYTYEKDLQMIYDAKAGGN